MKNFKWLLLFLLLLPITLMGQVYFGTGITSGADIVIIKDKGVFTNYVSYTPVLSLPVSPTIGMTVVYNDTARAWTGVSWLNILNQSAGFTSVGSGLSIVNDSIVVGGLIGAYGGSIPYLHSVDQNTQIYLFDDFVSFGVNAQDGESHISVSSQSNSQSQISIVNRSLGVITGLSFDADGINITGDAIHADNSHLNVNSLSINGNPLTQFTLTNGNGTTANGTAVDLGGVSSSPINLTGLDGTDSIYFNIDLNDDNYIELYTKKNNYISNFQIGANGFYTDYENANSLGNIQLNKFVGVNGTYVCPFLNFTNYKTGASANVVLDSTFHYIASSRPAVKNWVNTSFTDKQYTDSIAQRIASATVDSLDLAETVSRTIYVATTGDDVTGDGSVGSPYATILKAAKSIKPIINKSVGITIYVNDGEYTFSMLDFLMELKRLRVDNSGYINVISNMNAYSSAFTLTEGSPDSYNYTISGYTPLSNELQGKFLKVGTTYIPIATNTTSIISTITGQAAGTQIYSLGASFICSDLNFWANEFAIGSLGSNQIRFENISFTKSSGTVNIGFNRPSFKNCVFNIPDLKLESKGGGIFDRNCVLTTTDKGITINSSQFPGMSDNVHVKLGTRGSEGIFINNSVDYFTSCGYSIGKWYLGNFTYGIIVKAGNLYCYNDIVCDATSAITITQNSHVFINNLHILNANYLVSDIGSGVNSILQNYDVTLGNLVSGIPTNYFSTNLKTNGICNISKGILINIPSVPTSGTATLVAGTATINTEAVQTGTVIQLSHMTAGGTMGQLTYTVTAGTSFTVTSDNAGDTSVISWQIIK